MDENIENRKLTKKIIYLLCGTLNFYSDECHFILDATSDGSSK
jgi:hypothetical protein